LERCWTGRLVTIPKLASAAVWDGDDWTRCARGVTHRGSDPRIGRVWTRTKVRAREVLWDSKQTNDPGKREMGCEFGESRSLIPRPLRAAPVPGTERSLDAWNPETPCRAVPVDNEVPTMDSRRAPRSRTGRPVGHSRTWERSDRNIAAVARAGRAGGLLRDARSGQNSHTGLQQTLARSERQGAPRGEKKTRRQKTRCSQNGNHL
jgi:hypothetical protein